MQVMNIMRHSLRQSHALKQGQAAVLGKVERGGDPLDGPGRTNES